MDDTRFLLSFYSPHPGLRPFLQSYWVARSCAMQSTPLRYQHPDGGSGLIFSYGDPVKVDGAKQLPRVSASGPQMATRSLQFSGNTILFGIRFRPGGAFPFFRTAEPSEDLFAPGEVQSLYERAGESSCFEDVKDAFDSLLLSRLGSGTRSPAVYRAIEMLAHSGGATRISALARALQLSRRHLERLFREQAGYGPKQIAAIFRTNKARAMIRREPETALSLIAYSLGYADQAHFTREFGSLIGVSPARYRHAIGTKTGQERASSTGALAAPRRRP